MVFNINTTRKMHKIAHHQNTRLNSPHQPSLEKNAPPFCLRSLGPDSNAYSLLWIKHVTSRDVVANRSRGIGHENCQLDHCTCNKLCDMLISCKKILRQYSQTIRHAAREIILTVALSSSGNKFRCTLLYNCNSYVFAVYTDILSRDSDAKIIWPEPESGWCEHPGGRYYHPNQPNPGPVLAHCSMCCG